MRTFHVRWKHIHIQREKMVMKKELDNEQIKWRNRKGTNEWMKRHHYKWLTLWKNAFRLMPWLYGVSFHLSIYLNLCLCASVRFHTHIQLNDINFTPLHVIYTIEISVKEFTEKNCKQLAFQSRKKTEEKIIMRRQCNWFTLSGMKSTHFFYYNLFLHMFICLLVDFVLCDAFRL